MDDKITKIAEIFDKYGFRLSNTHMGIKAKERIIQEMMHTNFDEMADALVDFGNCIREIMRVVYNVKELEK